MEVISRDPASYRDRDGYVVFHKQQPYRIITTQNAQNIKGILSSDFVRTLSSKNQLVPFEFTNDLASLKSQTENDYAFELKLREIPFISYPHEWSFSCLRKAALFHLDIHIESLKSNLDLKDATAFNVQFNGPQPIFIDHLSFKKYEEGSYWFGYKQFLMQFVYPLILKSNSSIDFNPLLRAYPEGIPTSLVKATLSPLKRLNFNYLIHVFVMNSLEQKALTIGNKKVKSQTQSKLSKNRYTQLLQSLKLWVESLKYPNESTVWGDYADNTSYSEVDTQLKKDFIFNFIKDHKPKLLFDFGCNTGVYSEIALRAGAEYVIGLEFDNLALEKSFHRAQKKSLNFLPLFLDLTNPSSSSGFAQCERPGFNERSHGGGMSLCLALIHHLCIAKNVPLENALSFFVDKAPLGIIEFVPKQDPMVQELLQLREDIFPEYTVENFKKLLSKRCEILSTLQSSASGRTLFAYKRK